jgi:pimeloyl-ACP methyl ester carboxylesterase
VRYLTRHGSDRIARLALVAAVTPMVGQAPNNPDGVPRDAIHAIRRAYATNFPAWLRENARPFFAPDTPEPMLSWLENIMLQTSLQAVIELYDVLTEEDFRQEMRAIRVPTLIVQGTKDMSIPIEISGYKAVELVEGARLIVYDDAPHGLPLTHAARLNHDLLDFIEAAIGQGCP